MVMMIFQGNPLLASISRLLRHAGEHSDSILLTPKPQGVVQFVDILDTFGAVQHVSSLTNEHNGLLYVIVTPADQEFEDISVVDVGLSDHLLVSWLMNLASPTPT